jgi:hypothetical protein
MDVPLSDPELKLFTDGSSFIQNRWRKSGFTVTTANNIIQAAALPQSSSAQWVELWTLVQPGNFFVCGTLTYQWLPDNWKGIFTLAFITPQINVVPNNHTLPVPLVAHTWSKRAIQFIPLLIRLGITAGIGTDIGGIASSAAYYNQLSTELTMT